MGDRSGARSGGRRPDQPPGERAGGLPRLSRRKLAEPAP